MAFFLSRVITPFALCLSLMVSVQADTSDAALTLVRTTVEALRTSLQAPLAEGQNATARATALVEQDVVPNMDLNYSGRLILGRHWGDADATQRADFIAAYREMLLRTYSAHVLDYQDATVEYLSAVPLGNTAGRMTVRTRVTREGKGAASVDYRVIDRDGQWKVFDAVIDGVSIVSTLRTAVDTEIGRIGLPALNIQLHTGKVALAP